MRGKWVTMATGSQWWFIVDEEITLDCSIAVANFILTSRWDLCLVSAVGPGMESSRAQDLPLLPSLCSSWRKHSSPVCPSWLQPGHSTQERWCTSGLYLCMCAQLYLTLCEPMDCGPPGSFVHGIPQARILEWVAMSSSRGSFWPRHWTRVPCFGEWILHPSASGKIYIT